MPTEIAHNERRGNPSPVCSRLGAFLAHMSSVSALVDALSIEPRLQLHVPTDRSVVSRFLALIFTAAAAAGKRFPIMLSAVGPA
jgi:hypothetical protein